MKTILIIGILLMTLAVWLHSTQLENYDEELNPVNDYPHTWLVQDSVQTKSEASSCKTVDKTKK